MAVPFTVELSLPGFVEYWKQVKQEGPKIVTQEIRGALTDNAALVQRAAKTNLQNNGSIDTNKLYNSIKPTLHTRPRQYATVGSNLRYAAVVEKGRTAGKPMPPAGVLLGWMSRHNIPASAEYAIRLKISRKGIKAKPYLLPALQSTKKDQNRRWKLAMKNIGMRTFVAKRRYA